MSKAVTVLYQGWWWKQFSPFFRGLLIFSLLVTHCALYIQFVLSNLPKNLERKYAWKFFNLLMCSFKFNMLSFDNLANVHKYVHTTYLTSCFFYMTEDAKNVKWFPTFIRLHCYVTLKIDFKIPFLVIWNEHWTGLVYIFQIWRLKKKHSIGKICEGLKKNYFYVRPQIKHDKNWPKMGIKKSTWVLQKTQTRLWTCFFWMQTFASDDADFELRLLAEAVHSNVSSIVEF